MTSAPAKPHNAERDLTSPALHAGALGVWFPAIRVGTGVDVFTQRLCDGLNARGCRAAISWLPRRAEYLPWSVPRPTPPDWANVAHVNTWLHRRFIPPGMAMVATMHHNVHDVALSPYKNSAQSLYHRHWIRPMENSILRHADSVTAVSEYTARQTCSEFGVQTVNVIYNGMPSLDANLKPEVRSPNSPFRLLFVGSWSRRKGVDMLGPIMQKLGSGFLLRHTSSGTSRIQLPPNCTSLGRPDQRSLKKAFQESDALLFPTRLEGFGQVVLEAMAYGLPVITTKCSALPEIVDDGVTGFLCPPDDIDAFVSAAQQLATVPGLWRSMSRAANAKSRLPAFGIDAMVDSYIQIYTLARTAHELHAAPRASGFGNLH